MPCQINIKLTEPGTGPNLPSVPGIPGIPNLPLTPSLGNFPEDLVSIFERLTFMLPAGLFKAPLNFSNDHGVFDAIMKFLNMFFPYLMIYKFLLPIFDIIICLIEVLCALLNPFKLIRAIRKLFRKCLPAFLSLFPAFAIIAMLISLLLLLIEIVQWIIDQVKFIVSLLLKNLQVIINAFDDHNAKSILAAINKIGDVLCTLKNAFIILSIVMSIVDVIKEILKLAFNIPPCDDSDTSDTGCCGPDVCPSIIKGGNFTRVTGTYKYLNRAVQNPSLFGSLPSSLFAFMDLSLRKPSHQIFDDQATIQKQFINIIDAYDITNMNPKPVFFPSDANYTGTTPITQAAYLVDMVLNYNPALFGRFGNARKIKFEDCIVTVIPSANLEQWNGIPSNVPSGVLTLSGGTGKEMDGTPLYGYAIDGVTQTSEKATIDNFIFKEDSIGTSPFDGYTFTNVEYTFKPIYETLLGKALITLGCIPDVSVDKAVVNSLFTSKLSASASLLSGLFNPPSGQNGFPDAGAALNCMTIATNALISNFSNQGISDFQATTTACLAKLLDDSVYSLKELLKAGVDVTKSTFTLSPVSQFTTRTITVSVDLRESNGTSVTQNLPAIIAADTASNILPEITFGKIDDFVYDGAQYFTANISSRYTGKGKIKIKFNNNYLSKLNVPTDLNSPSSVTVQELDYEFIYATDAASGLGGENMYDTDGMPRRDETDVSKE